MILAMGQGRCPSTCLVVCPGHDGGSYTVTVQCQRERAHPRGRWHNHQAGGLHWDNPPTLDTSAAGRKEQP